MNLKLRAIHVLTAATFVFASFNAITPAQTTAPSATAAPPESVLPDRPDRTVAGGDANVLGENYESLPAGVAFRAPAGWREDSHRANDSQVVQFVNDTKRWTLTVNRLTFNPPVEMTYHKARNADGSGEHDVNGLFQETIDHLKIDVPGIQIDRQDISQVNGVDIGTIAARSHVGTEDNITLIALMRAAPEDAQKNSASSIFYSFNLNAPVGRDAKLQDNPDVQRAVETFNQVVDSVKLLDQSEIRNDQDERLFRTRALFVGLTESRIKQVLIPEQWLRLIRDGKDVGYMYIVEEIAHDLPRHGQPAPAGAGPDGVLVGVRSRTMPQAGVQTDVASWEWSSFDRQSEKWTSIAATRDAVETEEYSEIGSMQSQRKLLPEPGLEKGEQTKKGFDAQQPAVRERDIRTLNVYYKGKEHAAPALEQQLPPWYMPQAMLQLLPRLVIGASDKSYLFAAYNNDKRAVMTRYVDVGREQTVDLGGKQITAIPVGDRWGLEGAITTHYITRDGKYMGSINGESHIMILPTDRGTIEKIWKNAELTRPKEVEEK